MEKLLAYLRIFIKDMFRRKNKNIQPTSCHVHKYHSPRPQVYEYHHVLPLYWGGKNRKDNRIGVCSTGHINIHCLLNEYTQHRGTPPWKIRRQYGEGERAVAKRAWELRGN